MGPVVLVLRLAEGRSDVTDPENRQGSWTDCLRPMSLRADTNILYQW